MINLKVTVNKHIKINQLSELVSYDYYWLAYNLFPVARTFESKQAMDTQVSEFCTSKNLREFIKRYNVDPIGFDINILWGQVKAIVKSNNCQTSGTSGMKNDV